MKKSNLTTILAALFLFVFAQQMNGQGWRMEYNDTTPFADDFAHTLLLTPDGGFLLHGSRQIKADANGEEQWTAPGSIGDKSGNRRAVMLPDGSHAVLYYSQGVRLSKFDPAGAEIWSQFYPANNGGEYYLPSLDTTVDGGFIFIVGTPALEADSSYLLIRTDDLGNQLWQKNVGGTVQFVPNSLKSLADGGFAIAGNVSPGIHAYVEKRDANGDLLWEKIWAQPGNQFLVSVIESSDGNIVACGRQDPDPDIFEDEAMVLTKLDQSGNELWWNEWTDFTFATPYDLKETSNGDYVTVGRLSPVPNGFIHSTDADGTENWRREFTSDSYTETFFSVQPCPDGGLAIAGSTQNVWGDAVLIKTDALGFVYSHTLVGKVFFDEAEDCSLDGSESGLENWVVTAVGDETFYGSTDAGGNFDILLDTGEYEVNVSLPNGVWELCQPSYTVQAATVYDTSGLDIPVQPGPTCPALEVDISSTNMRPCFQSVIHLNICNQGTAAAIGATVEVELAPELSFDSSTPISPLSQNGQTFLFDIGDLDINECTGFTIFTYVECDTNLIGATLCTEAHAFPDTTCGEMFLGPNIELFGGCENDSVKFEILNNGDDMPEMHEYIIIEDNIILMQGDFQLGEGESTPASVAAANGATYHMVAAQSPDFPPALGNHVATFSIEGCVGNPNPGAISQLPFDEGEPWLATDCREVTASYDPNDKTPSPTGWTDEHLIDDRTDLEYRIRFQNTGNDTAFTVIVIDTLSPFLNPASIRPGAASHLYSFELLGQGVAKFIFNDILLPDSTTNEAASHGFVNFKISQKPDNEPGTRIDNTAQIYFDFNAPISTNTTFHTIGGPWVSVVSGSVQTFEPDVEVSVFPNPFFAEATFKLVATDSHWGNSTSAGFGTLPTLGVQNGTLEIYDAGGRLVLSQNFAEGQTTVQREALTGGLYFFRMRNEGGTLATGKVMVR